MLPGVRVALRLRTSDATFIVRGEVVRSALVRLDGGTVGYEAAMAFDDLLTGLIADEGPLEVEVASPEPEDWSAWVAVTAQLRGSGADLVEVLGATTPV